MLRDFLKRAWSHAPNRAVILSFAGLFAGLGLSSHWGLGEVTSLSCGLLTAFTLLWIDWCVHRARVNFDPAAVFASFVATSYVAYSILHIFFIDAHAGPFARDSWTVPNLLANAAFGIYAFLALGAIVGLTYRAALATLKEAPARRGVIAAAMVLPVLFFMALLENVLRGMTF